jgi:transcriptional regulatory protein LevR
LNSTLIEISKTGKREIQNMKTTVFESVEQKFNLDFQIKDLINKEVFLDCPQKVRRYLGAFLWKEK